MTGTLFDSIVFGPLKSRRLGTSLGINLLPTTVKICTFNCIYCECGWTEATQVEKAHFYDAAEIDEALEKRLIFLKENHLNIDSITFAGNGEPTMHPQFSDIIDNTIAMRDKYYPEAKISVLSNSTMLSRPNIIESLIKVNNIMKLDAGSEEIFQLINNPKGKISLDTVVENLKKFHGDLIIQSMFLKGEIDGKRVDNTTEVEVDKWLKLLKEINPQSVMIYSLDRRPPAAKLEKITETELLLIAKKVRDIGLEAEVY